MLSHRSESSKAHVRFPSIGGRSPQGIWHWRPAGLVCRSSTELAETETPLLEDTHRIPCKLGPRAKQGLLKNLSDFPTGLGGYPGKARGWLWLAIGAGHWRQRAWEYSSAWTTLEAAILEKPSNTHQGWEAPGQTTYRVGTYPTHQQTDGLESS